MDISAFISPLQAVHVLSIFNYLNTLSDVLYAENFLNDHDQHKPIPVINAMYHYILKENNSGQIDIHYRKCHLTRQLINGTDLYGAKEHEIPDPYYIDMLFNHIVNNLVFDRFTNVFGFIAEVARNTESDSLLQLLNNLKETLASLKYENEYGDDSQLDPIVVDQIFIELIEPLFPRPKNLSLQFTSIDYIYAQAGKMFLKLDQSDTIVDPVLIQVNLTKDIEKQYQEFIEIAHFVEQLILSEKVDKTALKIFALPALINYVYKEKENLQSTKTVAILSSPNHWKQAFRHLFTYVNDAFLSMTTKQEKDYRYQFSLALANYKNRSTIARELLEINCASTSEAEMQQEIINYENNPQDYKCLISEDYHSLPDLNSLYHDMINNITNKYYIYELESSKMAFGKNFINQMDNTHVVISKGLIHYVYSGSMTITAESVQLVSESHDLLQFYYPRTSKYEYYALVRKGYNVSLIREANDPELFRKSLGLHEYEPLRDNYFPTVLKTKEEKFDQFLTRIAQERSEIFRKKLETTGYDETNQEWWTNFALSLIPFYTCIKDIKGNNIDEAKFVCPLDGVFLVPIAKEIGLFLIKAAQVAEKAIVSLTETTMRTVLIRTSLRTTLRITEKSLIAEFARFEELFTDKTLKNIGISLIRLIDPGFELAFTIGQKGLRTIKSLVIQAERKFSTLSQIVKSRLTSAQYTLSHFSKKLEYKFGKDVYLTYVFSKDVGYGYKYIPLKNKIAEIRTIHPLNEEFPLVHRSGESKIYEKIDLETERLIGEEYFNDEEGIVSDEQSFEFNIINNDNDVLVEGGKIMTSLLQTFKSRKTLQEAVDLALKKRKLPEIEIRNELKKYAFPQSERMEINFVHEWMNNPELKTPLWAEKYKLEEPDLFFQLKYKETMDTPHLTIDDAKEKINALYPKEQHSDIIKELPVEQLLMDFKDKQAYNSARFEDYYALRWYGGSGYRNMAGTTHDARRMKNAIYKLAIRQSESPNEEFASKLFRGEGRLPEAIEKELSNINGDFEFRRFTSTSTDVNTAITYSLKGQSPRTRVMYVMSFRNPIVRARVEDLFVLTEKETILLPGTKFHIDKIDRYVDELESGVKQNCIRVEMTHIDVPKEERQKEIMHEIHKLQKTDTIFYPEEVSTN
ncbi:uncharacterized protein LOC127277491 [Leptopilina boulardi]|uniref:uncharacterized protein LOC127277491 n=1 Tax=Leptopilina boulardi TaxID=63433 RepID=UPI0021F5285E|nr:uncharacterized protein LOC127277491 [Leptopilina boulardi]